MSKQENNSQQMITINGQYVKDLSFESPNAPASLIPKDTPPKIEISLNLEATEVQKDNYEVRVEVVAQAKHEDTDIFVLELSYAGLFTIKNFSDEQKELVLLIHCPTLLFPYARRIISDVTRDGGFQPLLVDPVDFNQLYQKRKEAKKADKEKVDSKA